MRKPVLFLAVVAAALAIAAPAFAHEEISPKQFPTGQPTFFMLSAANEKNADLVRVAIAAFQLFAGASGSNSAASTYGIPTACNRSMIASPGAFFRVRTRYSSTY